MIEQVQPSGSSKSERMIRVWLKPGYRDNIVDKLTGHATSEDTRRKIGEANKRHYQDINARMAMSKKKGGEMESIYFHAQRGASVKWIQAIEGLERVQVENAINRLRRSSILPKPSTEQSNETKSKAHKEQRNQFTPEQEKSIALAQELRKRGLIREDVVLWNRIQLLFEQSGRNLPHDYPDVLRLEAYLLACIGEARGVSKLLVAYMHAGYSVDEQWFTTTLIEEQHFIKAVVADAVKRMQQREAIENQKMGVYEIR